MPSSFSSKAGHLKYTATPLDCDFLRLGERGCCLLSNLPALHLWNMSPQGVWPSLSLPFFSLFLFLSLVSLGSTLCLRHLVMSQPLVRSCAEAPGARKVPAFPRGSGGVSRLRQLWLPTGPSHVSSARAGSPSARDVCRAYHGPLRPSVSCIFLFSSDEPAGLSLEPCRVTTSAPQSIWPSLFAAEMALVPYSDHTSGVLQAPVWLRWACNRVSSAAADFHSLPTVEGPLLWPYWDVRNDADVYSPCLRFSSFMSERFSPCCMPLDLSQW